MNAERCMHWNSKINWLSDWLVWCIFGPVGNFHVAHSEQTYFSYSPKLLYFIYHRFQSTTCLWADLWKDSVACFNFVPGNQSVVTLYHKHQSSANTHFLPLPGTKNTLWKTPLLNRKIYTCSENTPLCSWFPRKSRHLSSGGEAIQIQANGT